MVFIQRNKEAKSIGMTPYKGGRYFFLATSKKLPQSQSQIMNKFILSVISSPLLKFF